MKVYELEETADGTMEVKGRTRGEKGAKGAKIAAAIAAAGGVAAEILLGLPVYLVLAVVALPAAAVTAIVKLSRRNQGR